MNKLSAYLLSKISFAENGCWNWTGSTSFGYGRGWIKHKKIVAHRTVYEAYRDPIPEGFQLDHLCRNRACVNPDHLEVVTNKTNVLRGIGVTAQNARKTHCKRGHPLTGKNLIVSPVGYRNCRTCKARWHLLRKAKRQAAGKQEP